jgi:prepilin-type N-terminal cleavage/methylation domain-containing protein
MYIRKLRGFTIIELIAVIVVLGISLAPVGAMFYQIMAKHATPEAIQIATALAEGQMEIEAGKRFSSIVNSGPTIFSDFPNYAYQTIVSPVSLSLANDPAMSQYKQLQVKVTNSSIGVTVNLVTIVTVK